MQHCGCDAGNLLEKNSEIRLKGNPKTKQNPTETSKKGRGSPTAASGGAGAAARLLQRAMVSRRRSLGCGDTRRAVPRARGRPLQRGSPPALPGAGPPAGPPRRKRLPRGRPSAALPPVLAVALPNWSGRRVEVPGPRNLQT